MSKARKRGYAKASDFGDDPKVSTAREMARDGAHGWLPSGKTQEDESTRIRVEGAKQIAGALAPDPVRKALDVKNATIGAVKVVAPEAYQKSDTLQKIDKIQLGRQDNGTKKSETNESKTTTGQN